MKHFNTFLPRHSLQCYKQVGLSRWLSNNALSCTVPAWDWILIPGLVEYRCHSKINSLLYITSTVSGILKQLHLNPIQAWPVQNQGLA